MSGVESLKMCDILCDFFSRLAIIVSVDQEAEVVPQETPGAEQSNTRRTQIVVGASTNTIHHAQAETPCTSGNTMHSAVRRGVMRLYKQFQAGGEVGKTGKSLLSIVQQLVSKSCYDSVIAEFKYFLSAPFN